MIPPGSYVMPEEQIQIYRTYNQAQGSLEDRIYRGETNCFVIACLPEDFSELTGIYITLVITDKSIGWTYLKNTHKRIEPC